MENTTIRAPRKARAIINRLLESRQITEDGMNWLIAATDPFHDTEVNISGYPDITSSRTIAQCYTYTSQIGSPDATNAQNWNAHVFFNPCTTPVPYGVAPQTNYTRALVNRHTGSIAPKSSSTFTGDLEGGVNAISFFGDDWTTAALGPTGKVSTAQVRYPTPNGIEASRLIAVGFEVVNTTSALNKQGSVTCYKIPANTIPMNTTASYVLTPSGSEIDVNLLYETRAERICLAPKTRSQAALYPNSRTWEAAEGCYIIPTLNDVTNPMKAAISNGVVIVEDANAANAGTDVGCYCSGIATAPGFPDDNTHGVCNSCSPRTLPWDVSGAFFQGLSPSTTLQLTVRYYIERAPTSADPELLVLAKPSPAYDPMILDIYSRAVQDLPVAVMVKENPLGEWFNNVMDTVADWAPQIGQFAGNFIPGAAALGNAVSAATRAASNLNRAAQTARKSPMADALVVRRAVPVRPRNVPQPKKNNKKKKT